MLEMQYYYIAESAAGLGHSSVKSAVTRSYRRRTQTASDESFRSILREFYDLQFRALMFR
jgi:hypothetical protein